MKYALLSYKESVNIGDEVQSIAAGRFMPSIDYYIDRDHLNDFNADDNVKLILNGWFMSKPVNWPPSDRIKPLFISFHLRNDQTVINTVLSPDGIEYLKKHEPIGCRDYNTLNVLKKHGVNAYFSGCLTLTLKNNFHERNDKILSVDTFYNLGKELQQRMYTALFPKELISKVNFIKQDRPELTTPLDRFEAAKDFLDQLAQAKLVITSRIHAALPCLAFNTPVVFINAGFRNKDRFNGLLELMRVIDDSDIKCTGFGRYERYLRKYGFDKLINRKLPTLINWKCPEPNPEQNKIKIIADKINFKVFEFISS